MWLESFSLLRGKLAGLPSSQRRKSKLLCTTRKLQLVDWVKMCLMLRCNLVLAKANMSRLKTLSEEIAFYTAPESNRNGGCYIRASFHAIKTKLENTAFGKSSSLASKNVVCWSFGGPFTLTGHSAHKSQATSPRNLLLSAGDFPEPLPACWVTYAVVFGWLFSCSRNVQICGCYDASSARDPGWRYMHPSSLVIHHQVKEEVNNVEHEAVKIEKRIEGKKYEKILIWMQGILPEIYQN